MISFIIVIKNRTKIKIKHNDEEIVLELFKNNLDSLLGLHREGDIWEFIVVDFKSDDVDMAAFLRETIKTPGCSYKHVVVDGKFSKGKGLNISVNHATHDILFFLDADMMIKTRKLIDDIQEYVVKKDMPMFPICYSYSNPKHTAGWKRSSGTGNAVYKKSDFLPYMENKRWGNEDSINCKRISSIKNISRPYYEDNFVHQWHPNNSLFKNQFYTN